MNGKGSKPRPLSVTREEYERRWEETFGAKSRDEVIRVYGHSTGECWAKMLAESKKRRPPV